MLPKMTLGSKPPTKTRWLLPHEAQALLKASHAALHIWLFIILALNTRARKEAILALTWNRVNSDTGRLDFKEPERPETKKRRTIAPTNKTVRATLLETQEAAQSDYVIEWRGNQVGDIKTMLRKVTRRAVLADVSAHTLKHIENPIYRQYHCRNSKFLLGAENTGVKR